MPVELRFSVKVTLPHPTIRGRPARSRGTACKCSIFSFIYIFGSGLISPELGLPTHLRAVKQQCDKSCARFHIYIPQTYPGINHLNSIFPAAAVSLCDGCETADRAACRMQESAERQQEREALSQPQWTHRLCVQSRELLKGCFTAGVLQVCSIFIKVSLSAFVDEFTTHTDAERRPASLLSDAFEGSLLCSLQPAIQAPKRFIHPAMCVSLLCSCACVDWPKWRARTAPSSPTACPQTRACEYADTSTLRRYHRGGDSVSFPQRVFVYVHVQASACVCVCAQLRVKSTIFFGQSLQSASRTSQCIMKEKKT